MKKIFLTYLLSSGLAFAQFPQVDITNFNGAYNEPSGNAIADSFNIEDYQFGENVKFSVEKQAGVFILYTPDDEIVLEHLPDSIDSLESVEWRNINMSSHAESFSINIDQLKGKSTDANLSLSNFRMSCDHSGYEDTALEELLDSCLNEKGSIGVGYLSINDGTKTSVLSSFYMNINQDNMNFSIKASGARVKGYGKVFHEPGLTRIRIDKAKVGFFSVKGRLFGQLRALESENVKVNNPWIEISY